MAGIYTFNTSGRKQVAINQLPPEAWTTLGIGTSGEFADIEELWRVVPWLNRGIGILSNALTALPWVLLDKSGEEVDTSQDYSNATGLWADPFRDLWLMEASLNLFGSSYWLKEKRGRGRMTLPADLRYFVPHTITPKLDSTDGLTGFERKISGRQPEMFEVDDLIYIWNADPYTEVGPPEWSRAMAAMSASRIVRNMDEFAADFFEKGMIKTTLLRVSGNPPPAELERIKSIWGRVMKGLKSAYDQMVVRSEGVEPVVIGEGISELGNTDYSSEKREEIASALGVPHSSLFSSASNFAVKEGDKRDLYEETVIPDARLISSTLNKQYFEPLGYRLQFRPEEMSIFQEEEEDRSGVVLNLANAALNSPPAIASLMFQIAGVDLPGGMEYDEFERILADNAPEPGERDAPAPTFTPASGTVPEEEDDPDAKTLVSDELDAWRRKALKRLKRNGKADAPFTCEHVPAKMANAIAELLEDTTTTDRLHEIFNVAKGGE